MEPTGELNAVDVVVVVDNEIPTTSGVNTTCEQQNISVMEKKQGGDILLTPMKMTTRKRKMDSSFLSLNSIIPVDGYKIIGSSILQDIINSISKCTSCGKEKTLELKQNNEKKKGLCETLLLYCASCKTYIKSFRTSKTNTNEQSSKSKIIDINLRSVVATTSAGGGLTSLRRICTDFNFLPPITENPYNKYIRYVEQNTIENCERSLSDAARDLRKLKLNGRPDTGQVVDVAVSVDGAWQKRYGFNSLNGMVFVIYVDTGYVLDYVVKSKFCHECKANKNAPKNRKKNIERYVALITKAVLVPWRKRMLSKCSSVL